MNRRFYFSLFSSVQQQLNAQLQGGAYDIRSFSPIGCCKIMNMMVGAIKYEGKRGKKKGITLVR